MSNKYGLKNEIGNIYGYLTVIERAPNQGTRAMWKCRCVCGNEVICKGTDLRAGKKTNCGCKTVLKEDLTGKTYGVFTIIRYNWTTHKWICLNNNTQEYIERNGYDIKNSKNTGKRSGELNIKPGDKFGLWTVLEKVERDDVVSRANYYRCQCECGSVGIVSASSLYNGYSKSCGCVRSHGEKSIAECLTNYNIKFEREKIFKDCKNIKPLPFDFYLPDYNLCIEYDGRQHFGIKNSWNNTEEIQERDNIKTKYCLDNNIKLLRISYLEYANISKILVKELNLLDV